MPCSGCRTKPAGNAIRFLARNGFVTGRDKRAERAPGPRTRPSPCPALGDKPAKSGPFAHFQEISPGSRLRGGTERTRTACQACSPVEPVSGAGRFKKPRKFSQFSCSEVPRRAKRGRRHGSRRSLGPVAGLSPGGHFGQQGLSGIDVVVDHDFPFGRMQPVKPACILCECPAPG
jgi:hypothetical protein